MDQESSINIPAQLNLFQMVTIPPFENSQERKDAIQLTSFLACPIVLINVGMTKYFEDEINKLMAILGVSN
jgi:hypothetical protein